MKTPEDAFGVTITNVFCTIIVCNVTFHSTIIWTKYFSAADPREPGP